MSGSGEKSFFFRDDDELEVKDVVKGRANDNGEASRPMTSAREKLIVAQVESTAPRKRREKDCRVWSCCDVALKMRARRMLVTTGRR
jgi:hypothetical protein